MGNVWTPRSHCALQGLTYFQVVRFTWRGIWTQRLCCALRGSRLSQVMRPTCGECLDSAFAVRFKRQEGFAQNPLSSFLSGCVGSLMCPFPAQASANPRAPKKSFREVGCKILSQPPSQPLSQPPYTTPEHSATDFEKMLWLPGADGQLHESAVASIRAGGRIGACSNNPVE